MMDYKDSNIGYEAGSAQETRIKPLSDLQKQNFVISWIDVSDYVHRVALSKGWWDSDRDDPEMIAKIHSEVSEAFDELAYGRDPTEEIADIVLLIMDWCEKRKFNLPEALLKKAEKNSTRPHKHNKRF